MAHTRIFCPKDFPLGHRLGLEEAKGDVFICTQDWRTFTERLGPCPNLALLWHRYFPAHNAVEDAELANPGWGVDYSEEYWKAAALTDPKQKRRAISRIKKAVEDWKGRGALQFFCKAAQHALSQSCYQELVNGARDTWRAAIQQTGETRLFKVATVTRCKPGTGIPCAFEHGGISLHPLFGFPILAGRSAKGIAAHYFQEEVLPSQGQSGDKHLDDLFERAKGLEQSIRKLPEDTDGPLLSSFIFGAGPEDEADGPAKGALVFHDAYPVLPCHQWFDVDVLTVHQKPYYDDMLNRVGPSDSHSPNPVHALTLAAGVTFEMAVGLAPSGRALAQETQVSLLDFARDLLIGALWDWGFGARTGAGYGLMRKTD